MVIGNRQRRIIQMVKSEGLSRLCFEQCSNGQIRGGVNYLALKPFIKKSKSLSATADAKQGR